MKNPALVAALSTVSAEDLTDIDQLVAEHAEEYSPVTPSAVFHDGAEVDTDISILENTANEIVTAGEENREVSLESAIALVNAVTHRYGGQLDVASMEAAGGIASDAVVADIRRITASLESAQVVSMEGWALSDMWDKIGMMEREIPELEDNIRQLEKLAGAKVKYKHGFSGLLTGLLQAFTVNGTFTSPSKAAASTGEVVDALTKFGSQAIENAKKASDMASKTNFEADAEKEKLIKAIAGMHSPADDFLDVGKNKKVMGNRHLKMSAKQIKVPAVFGGWNNTVDVDVSWAKLHKGLLADVLIGTGGLIYFTVGSSKKHTVKIDDLVVGLKGVLAAAKKAYGHRSESARKWTAHKELVADLKDKVDSPHVVRAISEMDRMGWSAINASFTIISSIIRECNKASQRIVESES